MAGVNGASLPIEMEAGYLSSVPVKTSVGITFNDVLSGVTETQINS